MILNFRWINIFRYKKNIKWQEKKEAERLKTVTPKTIKQLQKNSKTDSLHQV